MRNKMVVFFLVFGLLLGIGATNSYALTTYWDVSADLDGDGNTVTQLFDQVQYKAETTSYQYDNNGNGQLDVGETFLDYGDAYTTALLDADPSAGDESLNGFNGYEVTFAWTDLTGVITEITTGLSTTTVTSTYVSGTINFYLDVQPDGTTSDWADFGGSLGVSDDTNFTDGVLIATISNITGTVHSNFNTGTLDFTGGDYNLTGVFTYLATGFWFDEWGNDLNGEYVSMQWLLGYTAGDTDPANFDQNFGGTDPSGNSTLYQISANHDSSFELNVVPEPATMLLLGVGLIGLAGCSRKKFFKRS